MGHPFDALRLLSPPNVDPTCAAARAVRRAPRPQEDRTGAAAATEPRWRSHKSAIARLTLSEHRNDVSNQLKARRGLG
jgi:hypothetical protein